jgi:hypothetical protein
MTARKSAIGGPDLIGRRVGSDAEPFVVRADTARLREVAGQ